MVTAALAGSVQLPQVRLDAPIAGLTVELRTTPASCHAPSWGTSRTLTVCQPWSMIGNGSLAVNRVRSWWA